MWRDFVQIIVPVVAFFAVAAPHLTCVRESWAPAACVRRAHALMGAPLRRRACVGRCASCCCAALRSGVHVWPIIAVALLLPPTFYYLACAHFVEPGIIPRNSHPLTRNNLRGYSEAVRKSLGRFSDNALNVSASSFHSAHSASSTGTSPRTALATLSARARDVVMLMCKVWGTHAGSPAGCCAGACPQRRSRPSAVSSMPCAEVMHGASSGSWTWTRRRQHRRRSWVARRCTWRATWYAAAGARPDALVSGPHPRYCADCAIQGHTRVVRSLLRRGADIHALDSFGLAPVHYAVAAGHTTAWQLVRSMGFKFKRCHYGASPGIVANEGVDGTSFHTAGASGAANGTGPAAGAGVGVGAGALASPTPGVDLEMSFQSALAESHGSLALPIPEEDEDASAAGPAPPTSSAATPSVAPVVSSLVSSVGPPPMVAVVRQPAGGDAGTAAGGTSGDGVVAGDEVCDDGVCVGTCDADNPGSG